MTKFSAQLLGALAGVIMAGVPLSAYSEGQPPPGVQLQYLMDRIAVEDTMAKYAKAVDYGTPEEYAALFTEDGLVRSQGHDYVGREAIQKMITPILGKPAPGAPPRRRLRHILSNDNYELDGNTAHVFGSWATIASVGDRGPQIGGIGYYTDTLVKVNGTWLIAKHILYVDLAAPRPKKQ
jgi:uncharacterized protein (TIGR02246 family)